MATQPLYVVELDIRWRDLDAYDHVNNSVFLSLTEEARIGWFRSFPGAWRTAEFEPVLVRTEVNYRHPIRHPARVRVELFLERLGRSSLSVVHRISDAAQPETLYSDGLAVIVWVSPADGRPVTVPDSVRQAVGAPAQP